MFERYSRQIELEDFSKIGQVLLSKASVLVIGAGGMGTPVLQYLVRMGIGKITLVDFDVVSLGNLHRQILYTEQDLGKKKVKVAKKYLFEVNTDVKVEAIDTKITEENAKELISKQNLVIDAVDVLKTKFLINKISVATKVPLIFSSVSEYKGQVLYLDPSRVCLECLLGSYNGFSENKKKKLEEENRSVHPPLIALTASIVSSLAIKSLLNKDIKNNFFCIDEKHLSIKSYNIDKNETCFCRNFL